MSHQRATWQKVRGASLSHFKDQANRPRGRSDVLLQGHHLKIFQVQPYEEKLPWRMMRWQEGERGAMSLCLCEEWAGADVEMIVNQCALIFRSSWFLVCRGCCISIVVIWSSDGAVVVFNFFHVCKEVLACLGRCCCQCCHWWWWCWWCFKCFSCRRRCEPWGAGVSGVLYQASATQTTTNHRNG